MGRGIIVECSHCDYQREFILGVGEAYSSLKKVLGSVHYSKTETVDHILNNHNVNQVEFEHKIFKCPKCNDLLEQLYVNILYDDNKIYETNFECSNCNTHLEVVKNEKNVTTNPCPICRKKELKITDKFLWD